MARFLEYLAVDYLDPSYHVWNNFMGEVFFQAMLVSAYAPILFDQLFVAKALCPSLPAPSTAVRAPIDSISLHNLLLLCLVRPLRSTALLVRHTWRAVINFTVSPSMYALT